MSQTFHLADPDGALVASMLFGAFSVFIGVAVAVILKRLAAPADEPSYYGTTPRARAVIGSAATLGLLAIFWYQFWGGFYRLTITDRAVALSYFTPTRSHLISTDGLRVAWIPAGKMQQALQLTTADGTTYTSTPTGLSRDERAAIEALVTGRQQ
jgi:hypothetical protein